MNKPSSVTDSSSLVTRESSRLLIIGGNGMLAGRIAAAAPSDYQITSVDLPEFDMTDKAQVISFVDDMHPEVIINCAAFTNVDRCEAEQELANQVNGISVGYLAEAAKRVDATLVHISTDYVFDGEKKTPYIEEDQTNPQSIYGASKLLGEQAILSSGMKKFFIIRTSWLYGPGGNNFVETILRLAGQREELRIVADQIGTPTYTGDLAEAVFDLLGISTRPFGVYHFANNGQCSWYEFAKEIVSMARESGIVLKVNSLLPIKTEEYPLPASRPAYSVFDKDKYKQAAGREIPDWKISLKEYFTVRTN